MNRKEHDIYPLWLHVTEVILKIFMLLWIIFDVSGILLFYKTMIYKNCTYIYFMQLNVVIRLIYGSV